MNIDLAKKCGSCTRYQRHGDTCHGFCLAQPYGDDVIHDPDHPYRQVDRSKGKCIWYVEQEERNTRMSIDREAITHDLKCWPEYFEAVYDGRKPFEYRKNDRDYRIGDTLFLREWNPDTEEYTGRKCLRTVTYILEFGASIHGPDRYVVMGLDYTPHGAEIARIKSDNIEFTKFHLQQLVSMQNKVDCLTAENERLRAERDNNPLTVDEVMKADGVLWICYPQETWGPNTDSLTLDCSQYKFGFDHYGKTWLAYRRKPEGGADQ